MVSIGSMDEGLAVLEREGETRGGREGGSEKEYLISERMALIPQSSW